MASLLHDCAAGEKVDLKNLTLTELEECLLAWGEPRFRARQLYQWIFVKGVSDWQQMSNLPQSLRAKLAEVSYVGQLQIQTCRQAADGTEKYLFSLPDGSYVETVKLQQSYGLSVCVSTQVGCRMGCSFCASTLNGLQRNLTGGEIYDQVLQIEKEAALHDQHVSHVVLMGMGEPLDNYEQVLRFVRQLIAPESLNISARRITLSTCGLIPEIKRLMTEQIPLTLAVSLHAPNEELRSRLVPINNKYPLAQLLPVCRDYAQATKRRLTFEYALIAGVNDSPREAEQLAALMQNWLCHVNLIPVNDVPERGFRRSPAQNIKIFLSILTRHRISATVRKEMGGDIAAACGQLRRHYEQQQ